MNRIKIETICVAIAACLLADGVALASEPITVRGGIDANLLRGGLSASVLRGGLSASVLRGGVNANRMQGGTLFLLPQQAQLDPITRMTVLELMQRQIPQGANAIHSLDLRRQQPLNAALPKFVTPPPIPVDELAPILDRRKMQEEVAQFDRNFRTSLKLLPGDLAEVSREADKEIADLEKMSAAKIAEFECNRPEREEIVEKNHERMSELLAEDAPPDNRQLERVFGQLQNQQDQALGKWDQKRPDRDAWVTQAKAKLAKMSVHAQERMAQFSREAEARRALEAPTADADEVGIRWDEWYSNFANAVKEPLIEALRKHGDAAGTNTVLVTVWSDGLLDVQTQRSDNAEFDGAVLEAYKSLVFTPVLQFPAGSKRVSVSFYSDHRHLEKGRIFDVDVHKITGDVERR